MEKLLVIIGMVAGSWLGWAAGARLSFFAAFLGMVVGTAVGLYLGRKIARDYF